MPDDEINEDDILLNIVREQGCQVPPSVKYIKELDSALFFHVSSVCLTGVLAARGGGRIKYPTQLPGGKAQQFRIGTSMAEDVRALGFNGEVGYESFLYPSEGGMKALLRFLVDRLPKPEEEAGRGAEEQMAAASGGLADVRRVLKEWTSKQWAPLPRSARPAVRVHCTALSRPSSDASAAAKEYYAALQPLVSAQARAPSSLAPSLLASHSLELVHKESVVDEFERRARAAANASRVQSLLKGAFGAAMRAREAQLAASRGSDLSQYSYAAGSGGARSAFARRPDFENERADPSLFAGSGAAGAAGANGAQQGQSAEEREAALKADRERQLAELQAQLDAAHAEAAASEQALESLQSQSRQLDSELTSLQVRSREMEDAYLVKKRTLDLLPDAANNVAELQRLVAASSERLVQLAREWESHRAPLVAKLRRAKQLFAERKEEMVSKIDAIRRLREELRERANELREKERLSRVLLDELNALPKSINRQVYVKRIMDLMKSIDKQNAAIRAVLSDVKQVQRDINLASDSSARSFAVADEVVFAAAKRNPKDEAMTNTYKCVVHLREGFVELVAGVETKGRLRNEILALQTQMADIEQRNTGLNAERVEQDLALVKKENKELQAKIKQMQQGQ